MKNELLEAERAEFIQSVKALFIPLSLFLSCVIFAAGSFLVYNNESAGWGFIAVSGFTSLFAFIALVKYQNTYRARGVMPAKADEELEVESSST